MSTHYIGFYEDLTKIIFSIIIKDAPSLPHCHLTPEPRPLKTCPLGFQPGMTQTGLYTFWSTWTFSFSQATELDYARTMFCMSSI